MTDPRLLVAADLLREAGYDDLARAVESPESTRKLFADALEVAELEARDAHWFRVMGLGHTPVRKYFSPEEMRTLELADRLERQLYGERDANLP